MSKPDNAKQKANTKTEENVDDNTVENPIDSEEQILAADESSKETEANADYIDRLATHSTWYTVFEKIDSYQDILMISYKRNNKNKFVEDKVNETLLGEYNIFGNSYKSISICNFHPRGVNIILNQIETHGGHERLFAVTLVSNNTKLDTSKRSAIKNIINHIKIKYGAILSYKTDAVPTNKTMSTPTNSAKIQNLNYIIMLIPFIFKLNSNIALDRVLFIYTVI